MGKELNPGDENATEVQPVNDNHTPADSNLQAATVNLLDSTKHVFYVSKKAEGGELFDKVAKHIQLSEKDYFALSFTDSDGNKRWLYDDKKISKQLKDRPWVFDFEVKFYVPDPETLADDLTRYQLCLQVRRDIYTGRLPATLATHALLGSYVAQSERGDYEPSQEYDDFLKNSHLAPAPTEKLFEKIHELHKQHKGETQAEAEMHYLENAKKLSMYGVVLFPAKDGKGMAVQVGVCAHGINIYRDQIRCYRFIWQNIVKIAYRRNVFSIKLRPGELEKNETSMAFKLSDYGSAKRVWKCAVEHHTFFRLIQPDEKPHKGRLFRWGSARFRYQGRTQFQSKMASQMFDHPAPAVQRSHSARLASRSDENVAAKGPKEHTSPLHYADDGTSRDGVAKGSFEKRDSKKKKEKKKDKKGISKGGGISSGSDSEDEPLRYSPSGVHTLSKDVELPTVPNEPYKEASPSDGRVLLEQRVEQTYHLKGTGISPTIDPNDTEGSTPHITIDSWHETTVGPESVITDVDQHGNIIKRTVKTQQVKHTVQRQTYQTYTVPNEDGERGIQTVEASQQLITPIGDAVIMGGGSPMVETRSHVVAYESPLEPGAENGVALNDVPGELVSSRTITSGNRTVETITYKIEKDGVVETHVEHRVTIHSGDDIDHDAELSQAILEATNMNPDMTVEKIEVKQESQC